MNCWVLVTVHVFPNQERHGENWLSCYLAVRWWKGPWFFRKSPEMSHKWVNYLLVGGWPTPLKNISQIGSSSQLLGKIKKCSKPPTSLCFANDFWDSPPLKSFTLKIFRSPALSVTTMINHFRTWRGYQKNLCRKKGSRTTGIKCFNKITNCCCWNVSTCWALKSISPTSLVPQVWFCHIQWTTVDHGWRVLDYGI